MAGNTFFGYEQKDRSQPLIDAIKKAAQKQAQANAPKPAVVRERNLSAIQRLLVLYNLAGVIVDLARGKDGNTDAIAFGPRSDARRPLMFKPQSTFYAVGGEYIRRLQTMVSNLRQSLLQLADADGVDTVIDQELKALQDQFGSPQQFAAVSGLGMSIKHAADRPVGNTDKEFWGRALPGYLTIQENNVVRLLLLRAYYRIYGDSVTVWNVIVTRLAGDLGLELTRSSGRLQAFADLFTSGADAFPIMDGEYQRLFQRYGGF